MNRAVDRTGNPSGSLRWNGWILSLLFVLARPALAEDSTQPVTLNSFVGVPADSADRREFMQGFHEAMDAEMPSELQAGDAWKPSAPLGNPFRLVDMAPPDAAWTLDLTIGIPSVVRVVRPRPKGSKLTPRPRLSDVRVSRGLTIAVTVLSPRVLPQGTSLTPLRLSVYFAGARRVVVPGPKLPGGGYEYPWLDAGRVVGRAALEALHRANGDLDDDERADLEPATRMPDAAARVEEQP